MKEISNTSGLNTSGLVDTLGTIVAGANGFDKESPAATLARNQALKGLIDSKLQLAGLPPLTSRQWGADDDTDDEQ